MSDTNIPSSPKSDNGLAYAILAVAITIIIGLVVLMISGREVDRYIEFATFLVPLLIMQIWTASKVTGVSNQVNGNLSSRMANLATDIKTHINAVSGDSSIASTDVATINSDTTLVSK